MSCNLFLAAPPQQDRRSSTTQVRRFATYSFPPLLWTALSDGRVNHFAAEWSAYTGLTAEQSQGEGWLEALHPEDRLLCRKQWHRALETKQSAQLECRLKRMADQQYRWHLWSATPLLNPQGEAVQWSLSCTDIQEGRPPEKGASELVSIVETSQDILGLATTEGHLLFLNDVGTRILNRPVLGAVLRDLIAPEDSLLFDAIIWPALQQAGFWQGEFPLRVCENPRPVSAWLHCLLLDNQHRERRGRPPQTLFFQIQQNRRNPLAALPASSDTSAVITHSPLLDATHRMSLDILTNRSGMEALHHFAEAARHLTGGRYAAIGVGQLNGGTFADIAATGQPLQGADGRSCQPCPGVLGLVMRQTKPLRLASRSEQAAEGAVSAVSGGRSFLGAPIRRGNATLGCLYLTHKEKGGEFTREDEAILLALSGYVSIAIYFMIVLSRQYGLIRGLFVAQEEERRTVAYDLHDGLTQYVMAAHAHLETFLAHYATEDENLEAELRKSIRYLGEAVVESRRMVNGLRSLTLDQMGLTGALEQLLNEEKERVGWEQAELTHNIFQKRFDVALETAVYRVVQEALTNTRKHAHAREVQVTLLLEYDTNSSTTHLLIVVRDNGQGFERRNVAQNDSHVGLQGMAERVRLMGGEYNLTTAPGRGTTIRASFPVLERALDPAVAG